jgi:pimeloyl-ACP methyl ester carboxylesterase
VGHSWGGGWALRYAETHPDRVDRLVLIDSSGLIYDDICDWKVMNVPVVGELMVHLMGPSEARSFLQKAFHDKGKVTDAVADEYWAASSQPLASTALLQLQRHQDWSITERDTAKVSAPTLVMWGSDDAFIPRSVGEQLAARLPGNRFVLLDGCGHSSLEECPEQGDPALIEFLGKR